MKLLNRKICWALFTLTFAMGAQLQADNHAKPAVDNTVWDLTQIYATPADWDKARIELLADIEKFKERKGKSGDSADALYTTAQMYSDLIRKASRVFVYTSLKAGFNQKY